jgi:hypothetical protein
MWYRCGSQPCKTHSVRYHDAVPSLLSYHAQLVSILSKLPFDVRFFFGLSGDFWTLFKHWRIDPARDFLRSCV